jgi:hypothetical protein
MTKDIFSYVQSDSVLTQLISFLASVNATTSKGLRLHSALVSNDVRALYNFLECECFLGMFLEGFSNSVEGL